MKNIALKMIPYETEDDLNQILLEAGVQIKLSLSITFNTNIIQIYYPLY